MARVRTAKHPKNEEAAETETAGVEPRKVTKAQAVRDALADGLDGLDEIVKFAKSRYGLEVTKQQASIYKSKEKMKSAASLKRGRKPKPAVEGYIAPPKSTPKDDADLLDAMEAMKPLVASLGAEKVKRIVDLLG
jgi:hypothetical protein